MSKKRKSKEAKAAHKQLSSDAKHTGEYNPTPEHIQQSTPDQQMDHPAKQLPTPQAGNFWGDPSGLSLTEGLQ